MKLLNYQPHQKIRYSGGLISLVLLPILCSVWLSKHMYDHANFALNIAFFNPKTNAEISEEYRVSIPKVKYTVINLVGNNKDDSVSLSYAKMLLNRWKANKDNSQGIRFYFGKKAKYWSFIEAVNTCTSVGLNQYFPYENNMYATWEYNAINKKAYYPPMPCATIFSSVLPAPPTFFEKSWSLINEFKFPIFAFALLVITTIIKVYKMRIQRIRIL